jgi:threonine dehydrogenase-like Zn-dependent dehydrogenase
MRRRNLVVVEPWRVELVEEDLAPVPDGGLLLETVTTGLSAGTELTFVKGDHPGLRTRLDPELGLFLPHDGDGYPVRRLGYMEVARVAETRTEAFGVGDLVACPYGHATAHVADPLREHVVPLPADLDPVLGVYVAHLGPICANGLLHAAAEAVRPVTSLGQGVSGRRVLVTGAGLVGLLTALFAAELGADEVAVVDADPRRRETADALGFWALDADDDPALTIKTRWRHGPGDHGADVVFQCRGRPQALATALRAVRPQGTVVDLAFYTDGADEVRLGEEFHHNGLSLRSAQIGRVPRGLGFDWDRRRLSAETVRLLRARGDDVRRHLVTDVLDLSEAPALLTDVAARRRHVLSAVFTVDHEATRFPGAPAARM